eukprot:6196166-Pleurochrysis_carterae.AAC.2
MAAPGHAQATQREGACACAICMRAHARAHSHARRTHMHARMHAHTHARARTYARTRTQVCVRARTYAHADTQPHARTQPRMRTHTHSARAPFAPRRCKNARICSAHTRARPFTGALQFSDCAAAVRPIESCRLPLPGPVTGQATQGRARRADTLTLAHACTQTSARRRKHDNAQECARTRESARERIQPRGRTLERLCFCRMPTPARARARPRLRARTRALVPFKHTRVRGPCCACALAARERAPSRRRILFKERPVPIPLRVPGEGTRSLLLRRVRRGGERGVAKLAQIGCACRFDINHGGGTRARGCSEASAERRAERGREREEGRARGRDRETERGERGRQREVRERGERGGREGKVGRASGLESARLPCWRWAGASVCLIAALARPLVCVHFRLRS